MRDGQISQDAQIHRAPNSTQTSQLPNFYNTSSAGELRGNFGDIMSNTSLNKMPHIILLLDAERPLKQEC
jgi:hypothetical protein